MISKNKTKAEKKFHANVCEWARNSSWLADTFGLECNPYTFQLHHIKGAQYKLKINGVTTKVGEFLAFPIPRLYHCISTPDAANNPYNVTLRKKAFEAKFGRQEDVWRSMLDAMVLDGYELPFDNNLIEAVMR